MESLWTDVDSMLNPRTGHLDRDCVAIVRTFVRRPRAFILGGGMMRYSVSDCFFLDTAAADNPRSPNPCLWRKGPQWRVLAPRASATPVGCFSVFGANTALLVSPAAEYDRLRNENPAWVLKLRHSVHGKPDSWKSLRHIPKTRRGSDGALVALDAEQRVVMLVGGVQENITEIFRRDSKSLGWTEGECCVRV